MASWSPSPEMTEGMLRSSPTFPITPARAAMGARPGYLPGMVRKRRLSIRRRPSMISGRSWPNGSMVAAATPAPIPATGPRGPGGSGAGASAALSRRNRLVALARVSDSNDLLILTERVTSGSGETKKIRSSALTGRGSGGAENLSTGRGRPLPSSRSGECTEMSTDRNLSRQPAMLP